ncbi:ATP-binding cassette domain-containing protein [Methylobacter svalbardensis]|uniref:ATP-binding cassette domain-containing protein n=1 Tax=Methylobacter svalbardensis TaxID=3080016 RepID=UPI0030EBC120
MPPNKFLLEARQLVVKYKNHRAIDGLDLSVPAGCVYALLGGNGAGKTSTINTFLGFHRPTSGNVLIDGESPEQNPAVVRAKLAYLPENVALYEYLTGVEKSEFFLYAG